MSTPPRVGETIAGRYELRDQLRECASRYVYRAFDLEVEVEVALWWMRSSLFAAESQRAAFEALVLKAKAIKHPHLIRVFEVGRFALREDDEPGVYVALQLGTSADLDDGLHAGRPVSDGNFLRYAEGLVAAVQGAHDAQQVHGFLSPADVVEVAAQVKLCAVGFFAFLQPTKAYALWGQESRYLAPELAEGQAPGQSADWFSVAAILLELATGGQGKNLQDELVRLGEFSPLRFAALAPALRADSAMRATGPELIAAIRDAWQDPLAEDVEQDGVLPTVIDDQGRSEQVMALDVPTPSDVPISTMDVGVISFLGDDGEEEKTLLHESQIPAAPATMASDALFESESTWGVGEGLSVGADRDATVVEASPELKLHMLSSKPATPFDQRVAKEKGQLKSPVRPVLRPLSSLAGPAPNAQALGTFAPPKVDEERSGYWVYLLIALVLGALCVTAALALS